MMLEDLFGLNHRCLLKHLKFFREYRNLLSIGLRMFHRKYYRHQMCLVWLKVKLGLYLVDFGRVSHGDKPMMEMEWNKYYRFVGMMMNANL